MPFDIFISYAHRDKKLRDELVIYLSTMRSQGLIRDWTDEEILPGAAWEKETLEHLNKAQIILLLISPDFIASPQCYEQMELALKRHKMQTAYVIPILLRRTDTDKALIGELQALPRNNKPVSNWLRRDEAFLDIAQGIRMVIETVHIQQSIITSDGDGMPIISTSLWNIPFRRNLLFTGREDTLNSLYEALSSRHIAALSGLGGIGKTQIAIEYAYRHRDAYQALLWLRATSAEELIADFVNIAELLNLSERSLQTQEATVNAVIQWFANHKNWLLIFDNAGDFKEIHRYFPPEDGGHILVTTRAQALSGIAYKIEIGKMQREEAVLLLLRRAGLVTIEARLQEIVKETAIQAEEVTRELDGLPLAIDQAGAYVEETGCSLSTYLTLYREQRSQLLAYRGEVAFDYPLSVSTTWQLSFQEIAAANPPASELLELCAFLSAESIPEEILSEGADYLGPSLGPVAASSFELNTAMKVLLRYSLLYRDHANRTITVHRLVQTVVKDKMDEPVQRMWAGRAVQAVNAVLSDREQGGPHYQRYIAHALLCADYVERWNIESPEAAHLLSEIARYFYRQAQHAEALPLSRRALTIREKVLGPEHVDVADTLSLLGHVHYMSGKYADAALLYQRALTIWEKARGPENVNTLRVTFDLARLHRRQGNYSEAVRLYQKVLSLQEPILGSEHPQTLASMRELAELYRRQGKYDEALPLLERVLAAQKKVSGSEHPHTALALYHLARVYHKQKKYEEAFPLSMQAMTIAEKEFGPEHLTTAAYRVQVARLYTTQSKYVEAISLLQEVLAAYEKSLGAEHLHTAFTLHELAQVYYKQGNVSEAFALLQRALTIAEKVLKPDHPDMADFLYILAQFYHDQGRYTEALPLYQRSLAIQERVLGMEHPDTLEIREDFMKLLDKMGLDSEHI